MSEDLDRGLCNHTLKTSDGISLFMATLRSSHKHHHTYSFIDKRLSDF